MKAWTCVCWYEPQQLLVSTTAGEVLSINVAKLKTKKVTPKWETFSLNHNRGHVVVKSSPWPVTKEARCVIMWICLNIALDLSRTRLFPRIILLDVEFSSRVNFQFVFSLL